MVVAWVVFLPSIVSSFRSFLSAASCKKDPEEMFDGMTVPYVSTFANTSVARLVSTASNYSYNEL